MGMHSKRKIKGHGIETTFLRMPVVDAVEILLFIVFLAAALGAIFREKFVYAVFVMIILLILYEGLRRKKERRIMEKKFDEVLLRKRREAGL